MKKSYLLLSIFLAAALLLGPTAGGVRAQEADAQEADAQEADAPEADFAKSVSTDTSDKTGTNPINFQRDLRIYNEYLWLNTEGDGNQNLTTLEYRTPFAGGKWQLRVRLPYSITKADFNGDGIDDIDDNGLGDINFRLMTVPLVLKGANALALRDGCFSQHRIRRQSRSGRHVAGPCCLLRPFFQGRLGALEEGRSFCARTAVQVQH